jgi:uroporphyrinogen decarboxylase
MSLTDALKILGSDYMIQGNFDPSYLHYEWSLLEEKLKSFWAPLKNSSLPLEKWIMGLGHGVLQETPESNVRKTVEYVHENFVY